MPRLMGGAASSPMPRESDAWSRALRAAFGGHIELVAEPKRDPVTIHVGRFELPRDLRRDLERERQYLSQVGRRNEIQAVLAEPAELSADPIVLRYRTIEYAAVRALRRRHRAPLVLSASALPVCWENRKLYVQRRSPMADLSPSLLYGFGGALHPPAGEPGCDVDDGGSLILTALRELEEETSLTARYDAATPLALFQDTATASLELVLLGLGLRPAEADRLCHTAEGEVVAVPFDELPELLRQHDQWSPGGRFEVLSWLMLGAQRHSNVVTFGGETPIHAFWSTMEAERPQPPS